MTKNIDHGPGIALIAKSLNAALEGSPLDADALAFACGVTGRDFAKVVFVLSEVGIVAFNGDKLILGQLGHALVLSAYIGG